jgi:hypothetical protein
MLAKRQCKITDGRTPGTPLSVAVESATFTELLGELQTITGKSYVGQSASVLGSGELDPRPISGNEVLPSGDFRIFFMPEKQKSGI